MSTGGKVPRHSLAPRTPSSRNNNHFHTLIDKHQFQRVPEAELPSGWDMDRSNNAGKEDSQCEGKVWGNNSKSWDSQSGKLMNRIEHNTELIHTITYKN